MSEMGRFVMPEPHTWQNALSRSGTPRRCVLADQQREGAFVMERWKPVPGYEGLYDVSDQGRVRSWHKGGSERDSLRKTSKILSDGRSRYVLVGLSKNGIKNTMLVHRLALEVFVGPCPPGMECCHNNGDKHDNRIENLRWDTRSANMLDAVEHDGHNCGEKYGRSKLTTEQVLEIRRLYTAGDHTHRQLSEKFGTDKSNIGWIVRRVTWRHI